MTALSNHLKNLNTRNLSTRAIAEKAARGGYKLSNATVSRYLSGKHPTPPSAEALNALAYALGASKESLYAAADLPNPGEPFNLPADAALLDEHERQAVLGVVHAFIRTKHQQPPTARPLYEDEEYLQTHLGIAARDQKPGDDIDEIYE